MTGHRDVVDYALQRRALLAAVASGRTGLAEACDAHPYLLLAARHYGEPAAAPYPVCSKGHQRLVHYVYGAALGHAAGQAKTRAELDRMARGAAEFDVYVVEVCPDCGWNHLIRSFTLGGAGAQALTAAEG